MSGYWDKGLAPKLNTDDITRFALAARDMDDIELCLEFLELGKNLKRSDKEEISHLSFLANTYLTVGIYVHVP